MLMNIILCIHRCMAPRTGIAINASNTLEALNSFTKSTNRPK